MSGTGLAGVLRPHRYGRWFVAAVAALELLDVVTFYVLLGLADRHVPLGAGQSLAALITPRLVFAMLAVVLGPGLRQRRPWARAATAVLAVLVGAQAALGLFYLLRVGLTPFVRLALIALAGVAVLSAVRPVRQPSV